MQHRIHQITAARMRKLAGTAKARSVHDYATICL